jgi:hypothetical protein
MSESFTDNKEPVAAPIDNNEDAIKSPPFLSKWTITYLYGIISSN